MNNFVDESYDRSLNKYRKRYKLSNMHPCYLSFFITAERELESISFDAEYAEDYHYQIKADQVPKLCDALFCDNSETGIVDGFIKRLQACSNPIEIASWLRNTGIVFQTFAYY